MQHDLRKRHVALGAEIWALIINLAVALLVIILGQASDSVSAAVQVIAVAVVTSLTLVMLAFKHDILSTVTDHLELYRSASSIADRELQRVAFDRIRECARQVDEISRGILNGSSEELYRVLARKILTATSGIRATHVATSSEEVKLWHAPAPSHYYDMNKHLIGDGKSVERAFILRKSVFIRDGHFDPESAAVIRSQIADGVQVYLIWEEDIRDPSLWQDYIIVDDDLVMINEPTGATFGAGWRTWIAKGREEAATFATRFEALVSSHGRAPETVLPPISTGPTK